MATKKTVAMTEVELAVNEVESTVNEVEPTVEVETESDTFDASDFFAEFASEEYSDKSQQVRYPIAMLLNQPMNEAGLWVNERNLKSAIWTGPDPTDKHTFDQSKETETGILFRNPTLAILGSSPRFIEAKIHGDHPLTGEPYKPGDLIGIYENPGGYDLYQQIKSLSTPGTQSVVLRSFYQVFILDDAGKPLHKIPINLSVKGIAAVSMGEATTTFFSAINVILMEGDRNVKGPRSNKATCLFKFKPTFLGTKEGGGAKSYVCTVQSFETPLDKESLKALYIGSHVPTKNLLQSYAEKTNDSFEGLIQEIQEKIGINNYVGLNYDTQAPRARLRSADPNTDTGEDFLPVPVRAVVATPDIPF